jgi:hypothetical protein
MPATAVTSRRLRVGGLAAAALVVAYFVGLIPAAATVTIDRCYVTYDQLQDQHSRCEGHWSRPGLDGSGKVQGVRVATNWPALTADPNAAGEWEATGLTLLTTAWILPRAVASLTTVLAAVAVGLLAWTLLGRYLPRPERNRQASPATLA